MSWEPFKNIASLTTLKDTIHAIIKKAIQTEGTGRALHENSVMRHDEKDKEEFEEWRMTWSRKIYFGNSLLLLSGKFHLKIMMMKFYCFLITWNYCMMISFYDGESGAQRGLVDNLSSHSANLWETPSLGRCHDSALGRAWKCGEWILISYPQTLNSGTSQIRKSSCWLCEIGDISVL